MRSTSSLYHVIASARLICIAPTCHQLTPVCKKLFSICRVIYLFFFPFDFLISQLDCKICGDICASVFVFCACARVLLCMSTSLPPHSPATATISWWHKLLFAPICLLLPPICYFSSPLLADASPSPPPCIPSSLLISLSHVSFHPPLILARCQKRREVGGGRRKGLPTVCK